MGDEKSPFIPSVRTYMVYILYYGGLGYHVRWYQYGTGWLGWGA